MLELRKLSRHFGGVKAVDELDLVVTDLKMPGISGIELIRRLRHWTTVPIVVLSARDSEFDKIGALDQAIGALSPYDVPEFIVLPIVAGSEAYLTWLDQE